MHPAIIYLFPLFIDIVVSLSLFVSRHSFAEQGMDAGMVGAIPIIYGCVYVLSSLLMGKIIKARLAKQQMIIGLVCLIVVLCLLANVRQTVLVLLAFSFLPFCASLFFNAFQSFMLNVQTAAAQSLTRSVGLFTFSWSIGFALGPMVSAAVRDLLDWSSAYYTAALISFIIGVVVLFFKPVGGSVAPVTPLSKIKPGPALPVSGWMGILIAYTGWMVIATFWPVQAAAHAYSTMVKGSVEFAFAMAQALSALIFSSFAGWYHRPKLLLVPVLFGVAGLLVFALGQTAWTFIIGGGCYGVYTGAGFIYVVYHAMLDREKAVRRVSLNEVCFGTCCMAGPIIGRIGLASNLQTFSRVYLAVGCLVLVGVILQVQVAGRLIKKYNEKEKNLGLI